MSATVTFTSDITVDNYDPSKTVHRPSQNATVFVTVEGSILKEPLQLEVTVSGVTTVDETQYLASKMARAAARQLSFLSAHANHANILKDIKITYRNEAAVFTCTHTAPTGLKFKLVFDGIYDTNNCGSAAVSQIEEFIEALDDEADQLAEVSAATKQRIDGLLPHAQLDDPHSLLA